MVKGAKLTLHQPQIVQVQLAPARLPRHERGVRPRAVVDVGLGVRYRAQRGDKQVALARPLARLLELAREVDALRRDLVVVLGRRREARRRARERGGVHQVVQELQRWEHQGQRAGVSLTAYG